MHFLSGENAIEKTQPRALPAAYASLWHSRRSKLELYGLLSQRQCASHQVENTTQVIFFHALQIEEWDTEYMYCWSTAGQQTEMEQIPEVGEANGSAEYWIG